MRDDDDAMRALMGFASFGRPQKRVRRSGDEVARGGGSVVHVAPDGVHHVVPGTPVEPDGERVPASRLRVSEHGVAMLLHPDRREQEKLSVPRDDSTRGARQPTQARVDGSMIGWSLPSTSMELLAAVEATKTRFESLEASAFALARRRTNPYEPLGRHRFINRSAMKMANLDFLFQWTQGVWDDGDPFVFADVCGGPGGFSEYLLWRCQSEEAEAQSLRAVGFGITLKGAPWCDWKVREKHGDDATATEFHICDGADGTGDLYKIANIDSFRATLRGKYPVGAHLVVADGGFPDARDQSNQELIMTRLIVAETLTMFNVLRVGGSFVCKTFELSSPLILQLFWLLHNCFAEVGIVKPVTSRPASSERYIVALAMLPNLPLDAIQRELSRLVESLAVHNPLEETLQLMNVFPTTSTTWLEFVAQASNRHAKQQIEACERIIAYANPPSSPRQNHRPTTRTEVEEYYGTWRL